MKTKIKFNSSLAIFIFAISLSMFLSQNVYAGSIECTCYTKSVSGSGSILTPENNVASSGGENRGTYSLNTCDECADKCYNVAGGEGAQYLVIGTGGVAPSCAGVRHTVTKAPKAATSTETTTTSSTPSSTKKLNYTLLESFPGFFTENQSLVDLPALVLAIYKFGIWTVGIAGLFMLVIGGFMYMASAGNTSSASSAQGIITDSLIGIVAALGAYLILYVINPDLTKINLDFTAVSVEEMEDAEIIGSMSGQLLTKDGQQLDSTFVNSLAKIKQQSGIDAIVTSGLRAVEKQKQLIAKNCGGYPATKTCSPSTCLLKNGAESCPHTTGRAADIWALSPSGSQAVSQANCMKNISACFNNQYQKALIAAMKAEGFCVLSTEPWHFEKPKMSKSCNL